jgi:predicted nucleic acid-binding protein
MIETIVIDTNIVIRLLSGDKSCLDITHRRVLVISFITEIELLSWPGNSTEEEAILKSFVHDCIGVGVSGEIIETTAGIRKKYKLKVPDAIIAATAITKQLPLFSSDDIFKRVAELNFIHVQ